MELRMCDFIPMNEYYRTPLYLNYHPYSPCATNLIICGFHDVNLWNNMNPSERITEDLFSTISEFVWNNPMKNLV